MARFFTHIDKKKENEKPYKSSRLASWHYPSVVTIQTWNGFAR